MSESVDDRLTAILGAYSHSECLIARGEADRPQINEAQVISLFRAELGQETERLRAEVVRLRQEMSVRVQLAGDDEVVELCNEILEHAPEHFDGDEGCWEIAVRYVRALEAVAEAARRCRRFWKRRGHGYSQPGSALLEALDDLDGTWDE